MREIKRREGYVNRSIQSPMCTKAEASTFLKVSTTTFDLYEKQYDTKIRRSFMARGKFITKSIEEEALRVHNLLSSDIRYTTI